MAPFYGWGSTVSYLQDQYDEAVYFLPLSPGVLGTQLIDLGRMKG